MSPVLSRRRLLREFAVGALVGGLVGVGCTSTPSRKNRATPAAGASRPPTPGPRDWAAVKNYAIQTDKVDLAQIAASKFDMVILDHASDGEDGLGYRREDVDRLREGPNGTRLVLVSVNIGQAEENRFYWNRSWTPGTPPWLGSPDPRRPGRHTVQFWNPEWQRLMYGRPEAYIDRVMDAGFDGVLLAGVTAYESWERTLQLTPLDMSRFVRDIGVYVRFERRDGDFGIFAQNAERLIEVPGYLAGLTGVLRENLYFGGAEPERPTADTANAERLLDLAKSQGRYILDLEYTQRPEQIAEAYQRARAKGYLPYATTPARDRLARNPGLDPE